MSNEKEDAVIERMLTDVKERSDMLFKSLNDNPVYPLMLAVRSLLKRIRLLEMQVVYLVEKSKAHSEPQERKIET